MQVVSMHWTSTITIIYLELSRSKSPPAKTMTDAPNQISVKAHVENVFNNNNNKEKMKRLRDMG